MLQHYSLCQPRVLFSAYFITLSSKENTTAELCGKRLKPNFIMSSKDRIRRNRQKVTAPKHRIYKGLKTRAEQTITTLISQQFREIFYQLENILKTFKIHIWILSIITTYVGIYHIGFLDGKATQVSTTYIPYLPFKINIFINIFHLNTE